MNRTSALVATGTAAFLAVLVANVPARLIAAPAAAAGLQTSRVSGTVWNGVAQGTRTGPLFLGTVRWQLSPAALLTLRLAGSLDITSPDGFARGNFALGPGGGLALRDVEAVAPLVSLAAAANLPVAGGEINARFDLLDIDGAWPSAAVGEVRVGGVPLAFPGAAAAAGASGSFAVRFDTPEPAPDSRLTGLLQDTDGPLEVAGTLELAPPSSYVLTGKVRARPGAPDAVTQGLVLLGAPDAQGTRPFSLAGSL